MSNKQKCLGNRTVGLTFVVSAPAGAGKTTLVNMLTNEFSSVKASISCTTRPKRADERDGEHYFFLTEEEFEKKVRAGEFLEHVTLFGYRYGTSKEVVRSMQKEGFHVVLVIDTQGALLLMGKEPVISIFILPPSLEELGRRLMQRKSESDESLEKRLKEAEREMSQAACYDYVIVNDDLATAYQVLKSIFIAEEHRVR